MAFPESSSTLRYSAREAQAAVATVATHLAGAAVTAVSAVVVAVVALAEPRAAVGLAVTAAQV
jgi:hypothetical protein